MRFLSSGGIPRRLGSGSVALALSCSLWAILNSAKVGYGVFVSADLSTLLLADSSLAFSAVASESLTWPACGGTLSLAGLNFLIRMMAAWLRRRGCGRPSAAKKQDGESRRDNLEDGSVVCSRRAHRASRGSRQAPELLLPSRRVLPSKHGSREQHRTFLRATAYGKP